MRYFSGRADSRPSFAGIRPLLAEMVRLLLKRWGRLARHEEDAMTPDETPPVSPERPRLSFDGPHLALGISIAIVGVALTLDRLQILEAARILRFWPVGLVLVGAGMVAQAVWPSADAPVGGGRRRGVFRPFFVFWIVLAVAFGLGRGVD